jgi:hypothetical protein
MNAILSNDVQELRSSLADVIQEWMDEECETAGWGALDTNISDNCSELMADCAFNVLLAQSDLTKYYKREEMIAE